MDACVTSQFEQHLRAVLGWPLGDSTLSVGHAVMLNLLGTDEGEKGQEEVEEVFTKALNIPGTSIHWYGKEGVSINRKVWSIN